MSERFRYSTAELQTAQAKTLQKEDDCLGDMFENQVSNYHMVEFSEDFWAHNRSSWSRDTGELKWANSVFKDESTGYELMYDANYLNQAFAFDPDENPGPYRAVIGVAKKGPKPSYGSIPLDNFTFWYDEQGKLTVIKDQSLSTPEYPKISYKRAGDIWKILYFKHANDEIYTFARESRAGRSYSSDNHKIGTMQIGEEKMIDELVYGLHSENGRTKFVVRTATGSKSRLIEVPDPINMDLWRRTISGDEWPQVLVRFPVEISA